MVKMEQLNWTELGVWLLILLVFAYFVLCVFTFITKDHIGFRVKRLKFRRVLIVIAHPDDECMFFGPTIVNLIKAKRQCVHILCLSAGGYQGKGNVRKQEFWNSCSTLGLEPSNIMLANYEKMKDDPNREWPGDLVREIVVSYVKSYDVDTVVTFDKNGVSGHRNHCAIYETINEAMQSKQWPTSCKVYTLQSINIVRKYVLGMMDALYSFFTCEAMYTISPRERSLVRAAMNHHCSQLTWYRKLYVIFSRYMLINSLVELHDPDEFEDLKKND